MQPNQFNRVLQVGMVLIFFLSVSVISLEASNNETDLSAWSLRSVNRHASSKSTAVDNRSPMVAGYEVRTAAEAARPDLHIKDFSYLSPTQNTWDVLLSFSVQNIGTGAAVNDFTIQITNITTGKLVTEQMWGGAQFSPNKAAGADVIGFIGESFVEGDNTIKIHIDPKNTVTESDEDNNTLITTVNVSTDAAPVTPNNCKFPYSIPLPDNSCQWVCGEGTNPSAATSECVCKPGHRELRTDSVGRRVCAPPNDQLDALRWEIIEKGLDTHPEANGTSFAVLKATTATDSQVTLTYCENDWSDGCLMLSNQKTQLSSEWKREHNFAIRGLGVNREPETVHFKLKALTGDNTESTLPTAGTQYDWLGFQRYAYPPGDLVVTSIQPQQQTVSSLEGSYTINATIKNISKDANGRVVLDEVRMNRLMLGLKSNTAEHAPTLRLVIYDESIGEIYNEGVFLTDLAPLNQFDNIDPHQERIYAFGSTFKPTQLKNGTSYRLKAVIDDRNLVTETNKANNTLEITYVTPRSSASASTPPQTVASRPSDAQKLVEELLQRIETLQLKATSLEQEVLTRETARETYIDAAITRRLSGRLLIQPEEHGEVWYLDPLTRQKYYLKDGESAYQALRIFGLGISEDDFNNTSKLKALSGRIILRVHSHGEAYYIDMDGTANYLKDGPVAYEIMRTKALGISNIDLAKIETGSLSGKRDD